MVDETIENSSGPAPAAVAGVSIGSVEDKAWLFRVLGVHALAGVEMDRSFEVLADKVARDADEGSREQRLAVLFRNAARTHGQEDVRKGTVSAFFAAIKVTLTTWEEAMLDIPFSSLSDSRTRKEIFLLLAEQTRR